MIKKVRVILREVLIFVIVCYFLFLIFETIITFRFRPIITFYHTVLVCGLYFALFCLLHAFFKGIQKIYSLRSTYNPAS